MGGPVPSTTVEILVQTYKQTAIDSPKIWERFVDDVYFVIKRTHLKTFTFTNGKITFTKGKNVMKH